MTPSWSSAAPLLESSLMHPCSNLVRDSRIARDLITLLGGDSRAVPLARAAREIMRIEGLGEERLRYIFGQLLAADPRFELCDDGVRLREDARERLPLATLEFAVLDTETTGGSPVRGHRVIEVAAVRVRNGAARGALLHAPRPGALDSAGDHAPDGDLRT